MAEQRSILSFHAHPDDEASKGAASMARYGADGVRTILVCCTGGEEGDIANPALDRPEIRERLGEVRMEELSRSASVIGFDEVVLLGHRDSGMDGDEANKHHEAFAAEDLSKVVEEFVALIRQYRPQVILSYPDTKG
ncbi:MAG: PIG-L family deacetylase, partial [Actinomycetes bacterium]